MIRIVAHGLRFEIEALQFVLRLGQTRHLRAREVAREHDRTVRFVDGHLVERSRQEVVVASRLRADDEVGHGAGDGERRGLRSLRLAVHVDDSENAREFVHGCRGIVHVARHHRADE